MTLPAWPDGLDYKADADTVRVLEPTRPPIVTEMEGGPPMVRPTGGGRRAKLAYRLAWGTAAEYETFRAFVETTLYDGSSRFTMPVWVPATNDYQTRTVMLEKGQYQAAAWGLGWSVTFNLYVFNW